MVERRVVTPPGELVGMLVGTEQALPILAPPGETSNTKHWRFVIPLSTVIQAGFLGSCRRGSRCTLILGSTTVMMTIRRWS